MLGKFYLLILEKSIIALFLFVCYNLSTMEKIKLFFKKNKSVILKTLLIIGIIGAIAGITFGILYACGFTNEAKFRELKANLGDSFVFWMIIALLQMVQVICIPVSNQIITVPVALIFNDELWKVFVASWVGISLATVVLFFIGKYGGQKVLGWILGDKEKVEKCKMFMQKGRAFYVMGNLIPFLPNDILAVLAGMSDYNPVYTFTVIFITRAICIATSVWGFGSIIKYPWVIAILSVLIVVMLIITIILFKKELNKDKKEEKN